MILKSILKLLDTFNKEDFYDIENWSQSPIFKLKKKLGKHYLSKQIGTNGEILLMYYEIIKFKTKFKENYNKKQKEENLDWETQKTQIETYQKQLFDKIRPYKKSYNLKSFNNRLVELYNDCLEKFIGLKMLSKDVADIRWEFETLRHLSIYKLTDNYKILQNKLENKLNYKYNTTIDLNQLYLFFNNQTGYFANLFEYNKSNDALIKASNAFEMYSFLKMANLNMESLNRNLIYDNNFEINELMEIPMFQLEKNIFVNIYYKTYFIQKKTYDTLTNQEPLKTIAKEIQEKIKEILLIITPIDIEKLSSVVEIKSVLMYLMNITRVFINHDNSQFIDIFFDVIKFTFQKKLEYQRGKLNIILLKLIIDFSLDNEKNEYAEKLFNTYQNNLENVDINSLNDKKYIKHLTFEQKVVLYLKSSLLFSKKEFQKAYSLIKLLKYTKKDRFDLDMDNLKIKLLAELQESDKLENCLVNARNKVLNTKIKLPFKKEEKMRNFVSIMKSNAIKDKVFFEKVFKSKPPSIYNKKWLLKHFLNYSYTN